MGVCFCVAIPLNLLQFHGLCCNYKLCVAIPRFVDHFLLGQADILQDDVDQLLFDVDQLLFQSIYEQHSGEF